MAKKSKKEPSICEEVIFEQVYRQHAKLVGDFLFYRFGEGVQRDDLKQEAFVKLWEDCEKVPIEKAKSFLLTVAANLARNVLKHQKVVLKFQTTQPPKNQAGAEEATTSSMLHEIVQAGINTLSEKQREVLLLNRINGLTYKEIAQSLDISQKAVEKRMHHALINLRAYVKAHQVRE